MSEMLKAKLVPADPEQTGIEQYEASRIPPTLVRAQFNYDLIIVPLMLITSSAIMATAWLGHLRFKEEMDFLLATAISWALVLPEYAINISAIRRGHPTFTGGEMAAFRLCSGVVCVALVSRFFLGEPMTALKVFGFAIMIVALLLIADPQKGKNQANREK
jgi:uncharacterized protein (DUF486 family)